MKRILVISMLVMLATGLSACGVSTKNRAQNDNNAGGKVMGDKIVKSDAEWKKELSPEQYDILRKKGTERAFTGKYWNSHEKGYYVCAACGYKLFLSDDKFDSGCGWPSFSKPVDPKSVETQTDTSHFMVRTEVLCPRCGGHLGHVFEDGPKPTGLRYCINSGSIDFKAEKK